MVVVFTDKKSCIRNIEYSFSQTAHGELLTAWCQGWLCYASFTEYLTREVVINEMRQLFPKATFSSISRTFDPTTSRPKRILLVGTLFRHAVWRALLDVPHGSTMTYSTLALKANHPTAVRAVATSVGCNPISVVVPCHRIVPASGGLGNYHSGAEIKRRLLQAEALA